MNLSFIKKLCKVLTMLTSSFLHLYLNNLPFTNCDCMLTFAISLQHILHFLHWSLLCFTLKPFLPFPSPIVIVCQPSSYHCTYCISFISLNYVFYLEAFPSPVVIVCQPFLYYGTYYISFIGLDCVLPWRLCFPSPIVIICQPSPYHCIYCISFIGLDCVLT